MERVRREGQKARGLASPPIVEHPGGEGMGLETLSNDDLKRIANSKNVTPFRRQLAKRLLQLRAEKREPIPIPVPAS